MRYHWASKGDEQVAESEVLTNRAPVLTLWAAIVAEELGHDHEMALTLGKAVAGLNAQSKGRRLGIYGEGPAENKDESAGKKPAEEPEMVDLLGRRIPVVETESGRRAALKGKAIDPASVQRYFEKKFGDDLDAVSDALRRLARATNPGDLEATAYALYEQFRPEIPKGKKGWGAKGELDLGLIRSLTKKKGG